MTPQERKFVINPNYTPKHKSKTNPKTARKAVILVKIAPLVKNISTNTSTVRTMPKPANNNL